MLQNCRQRDLCRERRIYGWDKKIYGRQSSFTKKEKVTCSIQAVAVTIFLGLFFFRSFFMAVPLIPVGLCYLTLLEQKSEREKKARLRGEFREAIMSVAANLRAGYAVENAFRETLQEMKTLYGREAAIYREFYKIVQGLANRISIETLMGQFAKTSGLAEIQEFADVFAIAKRSGGNLTEIIYETAGTIGEKIDVEKEIQVLTAAKRLEQNIMSLVPFGIVFYVSVTSAGYFDVLYTTFAGRAVMTACLGIYLAAYALGRKISEIQV